MRAQHCTQAPPLTMLAYRFGDLSSFLRQTMRSTIATATTSCPAAPATGSLDMLSNAMYPGVPIIAGQLSPVSGGRVGVAHAESTPT